LNQATKVLKASTVKFISYSCSCNRVWSYLNKCWTSLYVWV